MEVYELIIPSWHAAIPADWDLEVELEPTLKPGVFVSASGAAINIVAGTKLRGGPESLIQGMLTQNFIKKVEV